MTWCMLKPNTGEYYNKLGHDITVQSCEDLLMHIYHYGIQLFVILHHTLAAPVSTTYSITNNTCGPVMVNVLRV